MEHKRISLDDLQKLRASQARDALNSLWDEANGVEDVNYYLAIAVCAKARTNQTGLILQDKVVWAAITIQAYAHLVANGHDFEVDWMWARASPVRYFKGFYSAEAEELSNEIITRIDAIVSSEPLFNRSDLATTDVRTLKKLRKAKNLITILQTLIDERCVATNAKVESCLTLRETLP